jgi:hypothetical protein
LLQGRIIIVPGLEPRFQWRMLALTRPQKITFGEMRAAAVPRVIRTHGADWQRLRYGIDKCYRK